MYCKLTINQVMIISIIVVVSIQLSAATKKSSILSHGRINRVASSMSAYAVNPNSSYRTHRTHKTHNESKMKRCGRFEPLIRERGVANVSMFSSTINSRDVQFPSRGEIKPIEKIKQSSLGRKLNIQDLAIYLTYISSMIATTLPVILIPMIAADPVSRTSNVIIQTNGAELTGKIVALSSIGAGLGKLLNGFVCQGLGSRFSGSLYLLAMASFSFLLSTTSSLHAFAIAGMDFCASIMWPVCNVLIANKYGNDPKKFASAITILSLGSTAGTLLCKIVGSALLSRLHWREVTRIGTVACSLGASLLFFVVKEKIDSDRNKSIISKQSQETNSQSEGLSLKQAISSITRVLSNRMFWVVAAAHSCTYLGRSCDKMLGTLLSDVTQLSRPLCGSLTSLVTVGFMVGLITGRKMESLDEGSKKRFIFNRHIRAVVSALTIAIMSKSAVIATLGKKMIAAIITMASGILASSLAVQFYQFPSKFAQNFGEDKAVCISFVDAMAFFVASPIWRSVSNLVTGDSFTDGWSVAWMMLTAFFALGTGLTMKTIKD